MSTRARQLVTFETLEGRRLLAGQPVEGIAEIHAGELQVTGTKGDDLIIVSLNFDDPTKVDVNLNGTILGNFLLSDINSGVVDVRAGKGDDTVRFDEVYGLVPLKLHAHGEQGNDTLVGGSLDDELDGGVGSDVLYGNDGNDHLTGGNGKDMGVGGYGDDDITGDNGSDTLYGESGLDHVSGGNGKDVVDGGDDADNLDGGRGKDQVTGGLGSDNFASADRADELLDKADDDLYTAMTKGKGKQDDDDAVV
jgi:Ca2+-binding RTX toxin-like protein